MCSRDLQVWREREEAKGEGEVPDRVNGAAMRLSVSNESQPANPDLLIVPVVQLRDEFSQDARAIS